MTALPSDQTTRAVELASAGATRHAGNELGEPFDPAEFSNRNAAALLASGLPTQEWMSLSVDLRALEAAGVDVTPAVIANLAEARLSRLRNVRPVRRLTADERVLRDLKDRIDDENETCVVYYMRLGNRVKIGYSSNLPARLANFQPEELLATETGGRLLEMQRHRQFADLRVSGEWFRLESPLTDWIATLGGHDADA